jgi:hypothetical protein
MLIVWVRACIHASGAAPCTNPCAVDYFDYLAGASADGLSEAFAGIFDIFDIIRA